MITEKTHGQLSCLNWQTLSDARARSVQPNKSIYRAALIVTGACNFECPYCKTIGGKHATTMKRQETLDLVRELAANGLKELRLSGGEPTLVPWLPELVKLAVSLQVRVAVSSNGYSSLDVYQALIDAGVSEFAISLDSTDEFEANSLSGGKLNVLVRVSETIKFLRKNNVFVYVGIVCQQDHSPVKIAQVISYAAELGVNDIKIMSCAQKNAYIPDTSCLTPEILGQFPLLRWRSLNFRRGRNVRGLKNTDCEKCSLVLDDVTVVGNKHYPCNVYFREGGKPIDKVASIKEILEQRAQWYQEHDSLQDPICRNNCMDILRKYNNRAAALRTNKEQEST